MLCLVYLDNIKAHTKRAHIFHTLEIDKFVNTFTCPNISLVFKAEDTLLEVGTSIALLPIDRNDCACVWHCIFDCLLFDGDVITENILNCLLNETINQCPIFVCGENKKKTKSIISAPLFSFLYTICGFLLWLCIQALFIYMRRYHIHRLVNR